MEEDRRPGAAHREEHPSSSRAKARRRRASCEESFSDSLITSAPVAAQPNPDTKAVLVDANALLFGDLLGYSTLIETAFRMPFALDAKNTSFSRVTNTDSLTSLQVNALFAVPKLAAPPLTPPPRAGAAAAQDHAGPAQLLRGLPVQLHAAAGQAHGARARPTSASATSSPSAWTTRTTSTPKRRSYIVNRWRLEKKDPAAAVSEPKVPITYWLDKNIPEKYRKSVADGILEWNKAFEKAGFRNAIVVKQQTEQDDFDTMDSRHASVRWFTGDDVGFAIGPSHVDPRSGEILDADIGMSDVFARGARRLVSEDFARTFGADEPASVAQYPQRTARGLPRLQLHGRRGPRVRLRGRPARGARAWTCRAPRPTPWPRPT